MNRFKILRSRRFKQMLLGVWLASLPTMLSASEALNFRVEKKRMEFNRAFGNGIQSDNAKWAYHVFVGNNSFKEMANVEIKYVFFIRREVLGSSTTPKDQRKNGTQKISLLKNAEKFEFETEVISLTSQEPDGGWYYTDGKNEAKSSLSGIWLRAYQNGKQIGEYVFPANLSSKQKWQP